jgi:hypothetical protein
MRALFEIVWNKQAREHLIEFLNSKVLFLRCGSVSVDQNSQRANALGDCGSYLFQCTDSPVGGNHREDAWFGDDQNSVAGHPSGAGECIDRWWGVDDHKVVDRLDVVQTLF